jgi:hypothetical protein
MYSFALFLESAIAIFILSVSSYVYAHAMYTNSITNRNMINQYNSAYDFFSAIESNSVYSTCISSLNNACIISQLKNFTAVYGLSYTSFYTKNLSVSYGNQNLCNYKTQLCLPIKVKGSFYPGCIAVCSDWMPSYGLIVVLTIILSISLLYSANNDTFLLTKFYNSYYAYRNLQEIELYKSYLQSEISLTNQSSFNELLAAIEVSARISGIGFQITDNSIILHTLTKPTVYTIINK